MPGGWHSLGWDAQGKQEKRGALEGMGREGLEQQDWAGVGGLSTEVRDPDTCSV